MIDNAEFLSVVHQLVSDSKECIDSLVNYNRQKTPDEEVQSLIVSAATLLTIHNNLIVRIAEQNANIVDQANSLLEKLNDQEK